MLLAVIGLTAVLLDSRAAENGRGEEAAKLMQSIVASQFEPPAGRTAAEMLPDLTRALASPDPHLRDDLAFTIFSAWIYEKPRLSPDELRPVISRLLQNLTAGIGRDGGDDVFQRSFSALTLSIVFARDTKEPFLREEEFRQVLDAALAYFRDERDVRGFDSTKGWIHSVAHTSDLLKFLARSRYLVAADQHRILDALSAKVDAVPIIFAYGEDERMARVALSLLNRTDVDVPLFRGWLGTMAAAAKFPDKPNAANLRRMQNARHLLTSLWAEVSTDGRALRNEDELIGALKSALHELP